MNTTRPVLNNELSRERVRLMLMMRRLVREEFGVTVLLSDDNSLEELLAFADRARSTLLRQMGRELEALATAAAEPAPAETASLLYRGAPVHAPAPATEVRPADVRRIYRGQVVG
ncbi:MAG: hypothetical protein CVV05_03135 [Gammaproteobacteria bacterium HGW-Gammaproteobacteria-1]|jgi:hypothetical protein|nr:MAG: hypothetical protein CVV05_03135 [Gammaproteobacteria bacterium HGW-Gammaproteobacteria-1]